MQRGQIRSPPFRLPQHKAFKTHVLFDIAKDGLDAPTVLFSMGDSLFLEQSPPLPSYTKELRIIYALEQFKGNLGLFDHFNYGRLAKEFGFGSGEGFLRAFYERTGVTPPFS